MKNTKLKSLLLITALAGMTAAGCSAESDTLETGSISSSSETAADNNEEAGSSGSSVYANIGEYSESENWKISLLDAKTYTSIPDESGVYTDEPDNGKIYLVAFLEAENVSGEDNYFNYLYLDAYADGYGTDIEFLINKPDGYDTLAGDVAAGKKIKGCLAWQVDENWSEFEFSYKNNVMDSDPCAYFKITSEDIA